MRNLSQYIKESKAEDKSGDIRMYMGPWPEKEWEGGWITTNKKVAEEYWDYQDKQVHKNMGKCPKEADPKGLLDGVTDISGEEHNEYNVMVVFDKNHESAKWGNTLASIVFVDDDMSFEADEKLRKKYPIEKGFYMIGGEVRNNTFYMALS